MKIDWKRKLTSRKFWAAVAGFVTMILVYFGKDASSAEQVAALIMAGASVVAYIIGEGLADSGATDTNADCTNENSLLPITIVKDDTNELIADITNEVAVCKNGYHMNVKEMAENDKMG